VSPTSTQLIAHGPGTPQEPHSGAEDSVKLALEALSPLALAAKVEMSRSTRAPPHRGQSGSASRLLRTSSSKRSEQSWHLYSKIGMT
jgi:hypothetical protein